MPVPQDALAAVERWVEGVVIAQNFCPYAAAPWLEDEVYLESCDAELASALEVVVRRALQMLDNESPATTLVVLTHPAFAEFYQLLELSALVEAYFQQELDGEFALALFHPEFVFAELASNDVAHYVHRSPLPILQLLRTAAVKQATRHLTSTDGITKRNQRQAELSGKPFFQQFIDGVTPSR